MVSVASFNESAWKCTDSVSGGAKLIVSVTGGIIELVAPGSKTPKRLWYGGAGAGAGVGFKIPTSGSLAMRAFNEATAASGLPLSGSLVLKNNKHGELNDSDFEGLALLIDSAAGLMLGVTGFVMVFGVPVLKFLSAAVETAAGAVSPGFAVARAAARAASKPLSQWQSPTMLSNDGFKDVLDNSKGMILIGGIGLQLGAGISGYVSYTSWQTQVPETDQTKMEAVSQADYLF